MSESATFRWVFTAVVPTAGLLIAIAAWLHPYSASGDAPTTSTKPDAPTPREQTERSAPPVVRPLPEVRVRPPVPTPTPVAPSPAVAAPSPCRHRMDLESSFHLRAIDTTEREGALELPGGAEVEVQRAGDNWRSQGQARTYFVRVIDGPGAGQSGFVFIHPSQLPQSADCPR